MRLLLQLLVVASLGGAVLHGMLFSRLRTHHPHTWMALGRPTIFIGRLAVMRFLLNGDYVRFGDAQLTRLARFLRRYLALYAIFLLVLIAAWMLSL